MKAIILALALVGACGSISGTLLGAKRCTWGPSYWCSDIDAAHECNAFQHCKQNVWLSMPAPVSDRSMLCEKCDELMDGINALIRDNATTQQALDFVRQQCKNLMPTPDAAKDCTRFLSDHLKEVMALLRAGIPDRTICSVVGLCKSDSKIDQERGALTSPLADGLTAPPAANTPTPSAKMCSDCKNFMKDIVTLYTGAEAEDILAEQFGMLCKYCPVADRCRSSIRAYIEQAFQQIRTGWDPEFMCENINFCPGNQTMTAFLHGLFDSVGASPLLSTGGAGAAALSYGALPLSRMLNMDTLITVQIGSAIVAEKVRSNENNAECMMCEWVIDNVKKQINDNRTEAAMVQVFERICHTFPDRYAGQCVDFVQQNKDQIMALLRENINAQVCDQLGVCVQPHMISKLASLQFGGDQQCDQCKAYAVQIIAQLRDPQTQQSIKNLLKSFCRYAPERLEIECEGAINQFVPQLLSEISQMLTPAELCQALHMCDQGKK